MGGQLSQMTTASESPAAPPPSGNDLFVTDTNALVIHEKDEANWRTHRIMVAGKIVKYIFKPDVAKKMPFDHAMKFLQDGWRVEDSEGNLYVPPPAPGSRLDPIRLAPGQVVANLDELLADSLKIRVAGLPGGEKLARASKEAMIDFLNAHYSKQEVGFDDDHGNRSGHRNPGVSLNSGELNHMFDED